MTDFSGLAIAGRIATPNDSDWDQARPGLEPRRRPAPERRRLRRERRRHRRGGPLRRRERAAGLRPGDRPRRRRPRLAGGRDPDQDRADARDRDRRRGADGAGRGRRALGRAGRSRPAARPQRPARLLPRRRRRRLPPRRRPQLVRPPVRLRLQPAAGDRAGHRRRRARGRSTPRTSPTSSGRCAAAAAISPSSSPSTSTSSRSPTPTAARFIFPGAVGAEAVRIWRDWAAGVGENVTSVVRFLRPPDIPDVPEPLRGTPLLTIDGACIGSREEGEAAFAPLLEIGEPMMNTFDQVPPAGALPDPHGPRAAGPRPRPPPRPARAARRGDRGLRLAGGPGLRHAAAADRDPPAGRRPRRGRTRTAAPSPTSTPGSRCSGSGCR